jgi:isoleucyl-tRNA synthetase
LKKHLKDKHSRRGLLQMVADRRTHLKYLEARQEALQRYCQKARAFYMAIIKHKSQRVGIFIDTQNLYHSAKNLYKAKVNFGNVVKEALAAGTYPRVAYVIRTERGRKRLF